MFCGNCGAQIDDSSSFCPNCGAPVTPTAGSSTVRTAPQKKASPLPIIAVVVVIVILVAIFGPFGGRSAKKTVEQLFTSVQESDINGVIDLLPPGLLKAAMEEGGVDEDDFQEEIDSLEQQLDTAMSMVSLVAGDDWSIETETLSSTNVTGDELKDIKQTYKDYDVKVSAAKSMSVRVSIVGANGKSIQDTTAQFDVIKVGKNWYIDVDSMGSIF